MTVPVVNILIADVEVAVEEMKAFKPGEDGTMVVLYSQSDFSGRSIRDGLDNPGHS